MPRLIYRYTFREDIPLEEVEATLCLALIGAQSLHGDAQARLDTAHFFDRDQRRCVIEASTASGADFNRLFVGYLNQEFGPETFRVERVSLQADPSTPTKELAHVQ